ncbi:hypothetical protein Q5752_004297 [Cryptotrichosporon argae]
MDFGSLSGRSSVRRKSLLAALGKPPSRQSAISIPFNPPPSSFHPAAGTGGGGGAGSGVGSATPSSAHFPASSASAASSDDHYYAGALESPADPSASGSGSGSGWGSASGTGSGSGSGSGVGSRASASTAHTSVAPPPGAYGAYTPGRSVSGASAGSLYAGGGKADKQAGVRRPEDVFRLVKDRLLSWSYLMQWYQGDIFWLNTLRVPRSALEAHLGAKQVDARARAFLVLGASLAALFDVATADAYLRAVLRLLEEWESWAEGGGKGVKNLFRGPKSKRPSGADAGDAESHLVNVALPFQPDFFLVHASTCSIVRDVYKKLLGMLLPARGRREPAPPLPTPTAAAAHLFHPATLISSASIEPYPPAPPQAHAHTPTHTHSRETSTSTSTSTAPVPGTPDMEHPHPSAAGVPAHSPGALAHAAQGHDALQQLILGELPVDQTLVGEGQKMTPQVVDLVLKVDARLKKHYSVLIREGDALARKVLDDELAALVGSMTAGPPMRFVPDPDRAFGAA